MHHRTFTSPYFVDLKQRNSVSTFSFTTSHRPRRIRRQTLGCTCSPKFQTTLSTVCRFKYSVSENRSSRFDLTGAHLRALLSVELTEIVRSSKRLFSVCVCISQHLIQQLVVFDANTTRSEVCNKDGSYCRATFTRKFNTRYVRTLL